MSTTQQTAGQARYTVIPRTLIFLQRNDEVLLLKGAPHKRLWSNLYNGIGGHVERGEDVLSAARRELDEEAGLQVPKLWLCGVVTIDTGENTGIGLYIFWGDVAGRPSRDLDRLKSSQEGTLEWVPIAEISSLRLVEDLPTLLRRVLAWQPGAPVFAVQYDYDVHGQLVMRFAN